MNINIAKTGQTFTIGLGLIKVNINFDELQNNADTIKHFAKLIIPSDTLDLDQLNNFDLYIEVIQEYLSCLEGGDFTSTIKICKDTNKLYFKDYKSEDGSIDIMKLLSLFNKIQERFL